MRNEIEFRNRNSLLFFRIDDRGLSLHPLFLTFVRKMDALDDVNQKYNYEQVTWFIALANIELNFERLGGIVYLVTPCLTFTLSINGWNTVGESREV